MYLIHVLVQCYFDLSAVIEHVRDGCSVRAFLLPDFYHVTVMFTGIKVSIRRMEVGNHKKSAHLQDLKMQLVVSLTIYMYYKPSKFVFF